MPVWFEADDVLEFFRAITSDKPLRRRFAFHTMVATMLGQQPAVKAPLQSKRKSSRAAEIALTFGGDDWANGPFIAAVYTEYKQKGGQRTAAEFDEVGDKVAEDGNIDALVSDLSRIQGSLNQPLQDAYDKWRKERGELEEGTRRKLLKELRAHQATKVGKHTTGNFFLLERARDGQPLLLISSDRKTAIKDTYVKQVQSLSHPTDGGGDEVKGMYAQNVKAKTWTFWVHKGSCDTMLMTKALRALGKERKVTKVSSQDELPS